MVRGEIRQLPGFSASEWLNPDVTDTVAGIEVSQALPVRCPGRADGEIEDRHVEFFDRGTTTQRSDIHVG